MKSSIVLRTHGGLGNQLFQILYGRLFSRKLDLSLTEIHDINYSHKFPRDKKLISSPTPNLLHRLISNVRLPKIIYKLKNIDGLPVLIGSTYYLDGYYQGSKSFIEFEHHKISEVLEEFRDELEIKDPINKNSLLHFRLGDFFKRKKDAKEHVIERLQKAPNDSHIITNNEELFNSSDIMDELLIKNIKVLKTSKMNASEILKLMSNYSTLYSNNSTLAFWGGVLANSKLIINHPELSILYKLFSGYSNKD
tara:strand:- start:61 stop:813 length:753 start_codon:yes stop_codon:yes gene_type:complete